MLSIWNSLKFCRVVKDLKACAGDKLNTAFIVESQDCVVKGLMGGNKGNGTFY